MLEKVSSEFGYIDILVNNAGIETIVPLVEMTDQQWERVYQGKPARAMALLAGFLPARYLRWA